MLKLGRSIWLCRPEETPRSVHTKLKATLEHLRRCARNSKETFKQS